MMASIEELRNQYTELHEDMDIKSEDAIEANHLLAFDYEYQGSNTEIHIQTEEFVAVCPWTGLPDFGELSVKYVPGKLCIELKSLKYYLLSSKDVGIVQEHAANRIMKDLVEACEPITMIIDLNYNARGGIQTTVTVNYPD